MVAKYLQLFHWQSVGFWGGWFLQEGVLVFLWSLLVFCFGVLWVVGLSSFFVCFFSFGK